MRLTGFQIAVCLVAAASMAVMPTLFLVILLQRRAQDHTCGDDEVSHGV